MSRELVAGLGVGGLALGAVFAGAMLLRDGPAHPGDRRVVGSETRTDETARVIAPILDDERSGAPQSGDAPSVSTATTGTAVPAEAASTPSIPAAPLVSATSATSPERALALELVADLSTLKARSEADPANAERLKRDLSARLARLVSDIGPATDALLAIAEDRESPHRETALALLSSLKLSPAGAPDPVTTNRRLLALLAKDADDPVRGSLIAGLSLSSDPEGQRVAEPILLRMARDRDAASHASVVLALAEIPTAGCRAEILRFAGDEREPALARSFAIDRLALEDDAGARALVLALSEHAEPRIRRAAYARLRDVEPAVGVARLHQALSTETDTDARHDVLRAIERGAAEESFTALEVFIADPARGENLRAQARLTLDRMKAKKLERAEKDLLDDAERARRRAERRAERQRQK